MVERLRIEHHGTTTVTKLVGTLSEREQEPVDVFRIEENGTERWVAQALQKTEPYTTESGGKATREVYSYALPISRLNVSSIKGWAFRAHQERTPNHGDPRTQTTPLNMKGEHVFLRSEIAEKNR